MAFWNDNVHDQGLNWAIAQANLLSICSQEPTTFTEATSTYELGNGAVTLGSAQNGDTDGRKSVVPALTDEDVDSSGTASHVALTGSGGSDLVATVALTASQAVTSGNKFSTSAFDLVKRDPT
ncbi:hypothetical protein SAMN05444007_108265 [Cribrihabitans marinus]|uniref:Uncharacterized protein n=1 Tax=Cribrihabitans marinus TaxID=1227549 RepID=A0A1H7CTR4_9RHOB|nr:hypothetical protein [Cribrihabitans marinus]GGH36446.1 hypothetical protein GCM10010973_30370 [Cribrihabitans marinus]SEJ91967.1 hypothetical protein SAMN05444007_108265 [Cribrihabitans marinus]